MPMPKFPEKSHHTAALPAAKQEIGPQQKKTTPLASRVAGVTSQITTRLHPTVSRPLKESKNIKQEGKMSPRITSALSKVMHKFHGIKLVFITQQKNASGEVRIRGRACTVEQFQNSNPKIQNIIRESFNMGNGGIIKDDNTLVLNTKNSGLRYIPVRDMSNKDINDVSFDDEDDEYENDNNNDIYKNTVDTIPEELYLFILEQLDLIDQTPEKESESEKVSTVDNRRINEKQQATGTATPLLLKKATPKQDASERLEKSTTEKEQERAKTRRKHAQEKDELAAEKERRIIKKDRQKTELLIDERQSKMKNKES